MKRLRAWWRRHQLLVDLDRRWLAMTPQEQQRLVSSTLTIDRQGVVMTGCQHEHQRVDVFTTAVQRSHPAFSEARRVTCEDCGAVMVSTKSNDPPRDDHPSRGPHVECLVDHGGQGVYRHCTRGCLWPCPEASQPT